MKQATYRGPDFESLYGLVDPNALRKERYLQIGNLRRELSQIVGNLDTLVEVMLQPIQIMEIKGKLMLSSEELEKSWEPGKMNSWDIAYRAYYRWIISLTGENANASLIAQVQTCPATESTLPKEIDTLYTNRVVTIANNESVDSLIRDYFWSKGWFVQGSYSLKEK